MARKSIETLLNEARASNDTKAIKSLLKEKKRRRDAKNKSRRKTYRKKVTRLKNEEKKRLKNVINKTQRKSRKGIYHIILLNHGKRLEDLYITPNETDVNIKFKEYIDNNSKVDFPIRFNSSWRGIEPSEYQIMIIKQTNGKEGIPPIRDEMGNYVNYDTNVEGWEVYDCAPYEIEETFWVYGFNPVFHRKEYSWIYNEFFLSKKKNKYYTKLVLVLYNKLIVDYNGTLDIVICKNIPDAIRLYNSLMRDCDRDKIRNVSFMGKIEKSQHRLSWINKLAEFTGWSHRKITRQATQTKKSKQE